MAQTPTTKKPRSIFEEVGTTQKQVAAPGGIEKSGQGARGAIRIWLGIIFGLVCLMIAVGGLTRLTDSGLSITEWAPFSGALPPMNAQDWDAAFAQYQQIPEYQLQNTTMTMSEFKGIFWWEWGHRQLGRVIGLVWALGFVGFLVARKIPNGWTGRLLLLGALGGLQGAIGWWMVHSGLQDGMTDVASYRLATHLGLAFLILGLISYYIFRLGRKQSDLLQARRSGDARMTRLAGFLIGLIFLQIILGALVAGIDAGRTYTDWPLMAGQFFPPEPFGLQPVWRNFFEDEGLVQFVHRLTAYTVFGFAIFVWLRARRGANRHTRFAYHLVLAACALQMVLGIVTVLYGAPWQIAILHQIGAVALWVVTIRAGFYTRFPTPQSVRG